MRHTGWIIMLLGFAASAAHGSGPQLIESTVPREDLLELYTSEGCSSCPPAEAWLSSLADDPRLWKSLVPVQFHVTYWDYLGWRDPFDSVLYTARQQQLSAVAGHDTVYTPEFVLAGTEWSGWFEHRDLSLPRAPDVGRLALQIVGKDLEASFSPVNPPAGPVILNVAVLAFGVTTKVGAGENSGRDLRHDFLVVGYTHEPLKKTTDGYTATLALPPHVEAQASRYAVAAWVSLSGDPRPLQAAGGWLSNPR